MRALSTSALLACAATIACIVSACGDPRSSGSHAAGGSSKVADCYGCHVDDYKGAHRHEGVKPTRCEVCHGEHGWHPILHNHEWPLTGAHEKASCFACHSSKPPVYEGTSRECVACHRKDYEAQNAISPSHAKASTVCDKCHSTNDWAEWPGHPKSDRKPPSAPPTAPVVTATATATATATVTKKPTVSPKPKPTTKPTGTPAPTPTPTPTPAPTPTPTVDPPIVTGPSRRH